MYSVLFKKNRTLSFFYLENVPLHSKCFSKGQKHYFLGNDDFHNHSVNVSMDAY